MGEETHRPDEVMDTGEVLRISEKLKSDSRELLAEIDQAIARQSRRLGPDLPGAQQIDLAADADADNDRSGDQLSDAQ